MLVADRKMGRGTELTCKMDEGCRHMEKTWWAGGKNEKDSEKLRDYGLTYNTGANSNSVG